jgi:hypothetical protein
MLPGIVAHRLCALSLVLLCAFAAGCAKEPARKVVLIGGAASEGPGRHAYPDGIRALKSLLETSPDNDGRLAVAAYPDGWPRDPAALDGAATLVLYFDGLDRHPLRDPAHRAAFDAAMARGAGLVVLHQASTVPPGDDLGLPGKLGATRVGMYDRTTETARLLPATPAHPVVRGIAAFAYRDEFYPTFRRVSGTVPLLRATLHAQYRGGKLLVEDVPDTSDVAWAFERAGGGRAVGFSGAHYLRSLDEPNVRRLLLNAVFWTARVDVPAHGVRSAPRDATARLDSDPPPPTSSTANDPRGDRVTFHADSARSGWYPRETVLTPRSVAAPSFGVIWESPPLAAADGQPARLYASPLYVDRVRVTAGQHRGVDFAVVFAATNHGDVFAINAAGNGDVAPGRILWRAHLGAPCRLQPAPLDGVPTGILATPVIDLARKRLYVTHCDPEHRWQAYALDLGSGAVLPGWPVRLDEARLNAVNANAGPTPVAPTRRFDFRVQRGALNLSPDGAWLYVVFGETETGWIAAVDTARADVATAFAAVAMPHRGSGGIWGAGGPAVDAQGDVFVVTGSGFDGYADRPHDWTQSVLMLAPPRRGGWTLRGTYTPFNYCLTAAMDIDLGSGGALLLPDLDAAATATPRLMAVGGKQGNVYLLDRSRLPGRLDRRPPCGDDASRDQSLLPPQSQPQFGGRGPLNVFGLYSERDAALDQARARSLPAFYRDADGAAYLFATGNTKAKTGSSVSVPPSLVRLRVATAPGRPAWLRVDRAQKTLVLGNPGSPVITSHGGRDAIVWILDENAGRSASLQGPDAPRPVLYALDAMSLAILWRSGDGELFTSGKYNEPAFGHGSVFVGTDRIQAFGAGGRRLPGRNVAQAPAATPVANSATNSAAVGTASDGATIFRQRCAICHDHPQGNIPPRRVLATYEHARIVEALSHGAMRAQAQGLDPQQIENLARYLKQ